MVLLTAHGARTLPYPPMPALRGVRYPPTRPLRHVRYALRRVRYQSTRVLRHTLHAVRSAAGRNHAQEPAIAVQLEARNADFCLISRCISLRARYAMPAIPPYARATRCPVRRARMVLRHVRYRGRVWGYAMSGTEAAYGATREAAPSRVASHTPPRGAAPDLAGPNPNPSCCSPPSKSPALQGSSDED
eukprot:2206970-Rhodomonas_salina.1